MTTGRTDLARWMRGRLFIHGVRDDTPCRTALDVITTLVVEAPREALEKWREKFERAMWTVRPPDRDSWGLAPEQQQAMGRLT